jgi:two-component system alkaline phosphatase synthesis response regulator PhoP
VTKKILAIDDSPTLRKLLNYYLSRRGYEVSEANNGKAGLDFIMRENFDLVILDMEMPVMKGDAVLQKLKEMGNFSVPVLILSADKDEENKAKAIALGASFYLTKPFKPNEVVSRIEGIFAEKEKKNKPL